VWFGTDANIIGISRASNPTTETKYASAYVQDTLTVGNLTANLGLRYDRQNGSNLPYDLAANPAFSQVLPATSYGGSDSGFDWTNVTPRLGVTWALGADRKTLLRASYSRFADQLGAGAASWLNPGLIPQYVYFYSSNGGDGNVTPGQIDFGSGPYSFSSTVNPLTRGLLQSNAVDPDLSAPLTDEVLLGVEHALLPEFVVGVNLTYRKLSNLLDQEYLVFDGNPYEGGNLDSTGRRPVSGDYAPAPGVPTSTSGSFVPSGSTTRPTRICDDPACTTTHVVQVPMQLPNGRGFTLDYYQLRDGLSTRSGQYLFNGGGEQTYKGASLVFNKRLANRWMLRGNVTVSDWTWSKVNESCTIDPTQPLGGGCREGDQVLQGSGTGSGSKGGVYINSKWAYSVNGLYQVAPDRRWGFNVAASLNGRQGYPVPYYHRVIATDDPNGRFIRVQATDRPDSVRLPNVHLADARIEKEFRFSDVGATIGVDVFNVFNRSTVLQRQHRLGITTSDFVTEVSSPRIYRLGLRLSFR
jgi:hypothetical protein